MVLTGHISDEATEASTQGAEWIRLPDSRVAMICLQMEGACQVSTAPPPPPPPPKKKKKKMHVCRLLQREY